MKTIFDKIWDKHVVKQIDENNDVLFIDHHFIHEVTSPQAFDGLRKRKSMLFMPHRVTATADHNVPTKNQHLPIQNKESYNQVETLRKNCEEFGIDFYGMGHKNQGIVHVIGPELGITQPGMTIVCGDSHTSTHGAFGSIAFGIGTSQVEQVFASQCLILSKPKTFKIEVNGKLKSGVTAKDVILYIISIVGAEGGTGHFVEYTGEVFRNMTMDERMTVCNMSIEMGARGGLVGVDRTTTSYVAERVKVSESEILSWMSLNTDEKAKFDKELVISANEITPMITIGTSPDTAIPIDGRVTPVIGKEYMGLLENEAIANQKIDYVFIGSCTNGRLEDLRQAAKVLKGYKKADGVQAWVVPGSVRVREQAIGEGLDKIFEEAGFEFREPGCSACLAMNEDKIPSGAFCVSTSNRNFEGRQGAGAKTLLASPVTAAASAIAGYVTNPTIF